MPTILVKVFGREKLAAIWVEVTAEVRAPAKPSFTNSVMPAGRFATSAKKEEGERSTSEENDSEHQTID